MNTPQKVADQIKALLDELVAMTGEKAVAKTGAADTEINSEKNLGKRVLKITAIAGAT